MRKTFTLLIALLALTVSTWAQVPTVTWENTNLQSVEVDGSTDNGKTQTVDNITITADAPDEGDASEFYTLESNTTIHITNGGTLTFTPASGNLTRVVITCSSISDEEDLGSGWTTDDSHGALELSWSGNASFVTLAANGSLADFQIYGISLIEFFTAEAAPEDPTPSSTHDPVTWDAEYLATFELNELFECKNFGNIGTYSGTITADHEGVIATISAETDGSYANFKTYANNTSIDLRNGATLEFSTGLGQFESIVIQINPDYQFGYNMAGWFWDNEAKQLIWPNPYQDSEASSSVILDSSSDNIYISDITSIVFSFADATPTPTPTPAGPSFIWAERQVKHVDLQSLSESETKTTPVIKNIITSLTKSSASGECKFADRELWIANSGELTFKSIVGDLSMVVITCDDYNDVWSSDIQPSAEWTYDSGAKTFTWAGTPSDEVTISGNIDFLISSIEFFYTPAAAPRKGEQFMGDYNQIYEITGAQTAKLPAQTIDHTLNIPASVEYYGDTYYVTEIDDYAFSQNKDLPNIMGGENIAKIGVGAFNGCIRMDEANIESAVLDTIGDAAFINCKLLLSFMCETEFPPVLGSSVFTNDSYLNHIRVFTPTDYQTTAGWNWYADKIGGMYPTPAIGEQFFWHNQMTSNLYEVSSTSPREAKVLPYNANVNAIYPITREGTLVIPEMADYMNFSYNITGIGANAYKDSTRFNIVVMPLAMKSIESGAFLNCTGVEKVYFLWDDPTTVSWYDKDKGFEFKTAASGNTKIFVPEGRLAAYQAWAPAWASCMVEGDVVDVSATEDPDDHARYFRTFYDSSSDYMMPAGVWAHAGYVEGGSFMLSPVAFDGQILPRGTAVVLESDTREYRLIPMGNDAPLYYGRNELVGTDENLEVSTLGTNSNKVYVLNTQATIGGDLHVGMGMYKYTGTTLGAHKAYLIYDAPSGPNSAPARFVFKHEDQATDVENVQGDKAQCTKILRDGQLIIIKDGKEFNAQGLIIK